MRTGTHGGQHLWASAIRAGVWLYLVSFLLTGAFPLWLDQMRYIAPQQI